MSYEKLGQDALGYALCRYGNSRVSFRGPKCDLSKDFVAFLGGTETFGKFVPKPFPTLVQKATGLGIANFGCVNAGIDVFLNEPEVQNAARMSQVTVIQIMGAQNMSNRFYRVHPRRNDRFVGASQTMRMVFREIDFTEFHFNRHMLGSLRAKAPDRFSVVRDELKQSWVARMHLLLERISGKIILLWIGDHLPDVHVGQSGLGPDPLFVDRQMLEDLRPLVSDIVEVQISDVARSKGSAGMVCNDLEKPAARKLPGPSVHEEVASALSAPLLRLAF